MADPQLGLRLIVYGYAESSKQINAFRNDMNRLSNDIVTSSGIFTSFSRNLVHAGDALVSLGRTLTFGVSLPLLGTVAGLTKAGIEFEDAFAGITKTVDGVSDSFGNLTDVGEQVRNEIRGLALEIPITANELSRVGQVSGQLGISAQQLTGFTKTMALLGVTTDLSAEQAAFAIARLANIMGVSSEDMSKFAIQAGNAIVDLGNNAAATEPEIVNLALRLASAGRQANLTAQEILGISATLAEVGVKAERGGTAVSRVIYEMIYAISDGGEELEMFANIVGLSTDEFARRFKDDAVGAIELFLTRLAKLQDEGQISSDTITALGLSGVRVREVLNILGPNVELLRENIARSNTAWAEQIALQEEAQKRFKTVKSQIQLLKNAFTDLGITIFDLVSDDLNVLIKSIIKTIESFKNLDPEIQKTIIRTSLLVSTVGPVLIILGTLAQISGNAGIALAGLNKQFLSLLKLPFSPLTSIFGSLFGGKNAKGVKEAGIVSNLLKPFKNAFNLLFDKIFSAPGENLLFKGLKSLFTIPANLIKNITSPFLSTGKFIAQNILSGIGGIFNALKFSLGPFGALFQVLQQTLSGVTGIFKFLGGGALNVLDVFGGALGKIGGTLWSFIPLVGKTLPKVFTGFFGILPKLALLAAGAFTLIFAPKVISQLVKNWDDVLDQIKTSIGQFQKDLKEGGLEKAILLFFSGGSTGSGRKGGLLGIAKALGASEENARKFSYAMGVASYWTLQIVKQTADFVKSLFTGVTSAQLLGDTTKSTSERLIALAAGLGKFLEGFLKGWTSSFDGIRSAFDILITAIRRSFTAIGGLFDAIFGNAKKSSADFIDSLEPGVESATLTIGEKIGKIIGDIITVTAQFFAIITDAITVVINAFTQLVRAYNEGGVKGVFEELGPILETLWDGAIIAAEGLWDVVKPYLENFITSASNWLVNTGAPALAAGAKSLFGTLSDGLQDVLFGSTKQQLVPFDVNDPRRATTPLTNAFEFRDVKSIGLIEQITNYITDPENIQKVKDALGTVVEAVGNFLSNDVVPTLKPYISSFFTSLSEEVGPYATAVGRYILSQIADALLEVTFWSPLLSGLKKIGLVDESDWADFIGLDSALGLGKSFEEILQEELTGKMPTEEVSAESLELGQLTAQQWEFGLIQLSPQLVTTANNTAHSVINGVKSILGIGSPSSVFYSIGTDTIQGLINGIVSMQTPLQIVLDGITSQFGNLATNVINTLQPLHTEFNTLYSLIQTVLGLLSSSVLNALNTITGTAVNTSTVNSSTSSVYAPTIYGPINQQSVNQNQQIYSQYLLSQQAVG